jgi:hypothetical protein
VQYGICKYVRTTVQITAARFRTLYYIQMEGSASSPSDGEWSNCYQNLRGRGDGGARFELEEQVRSFEDCEIHRTKTETLSLQILVLQLLLSVLIALHRGRLYCQEGDVLRLDWAELL